MRNEDESCRKQDLRRAKLKSCCRVSSPHAASSCPVNDKTGQSVDVATLRHLLKDSTRSQIKDSGYYFCKAPDCDTVYFHPESGQCFQKKDLNVRVGLKEIKDPVWLCYCFDISKKMIEAEIEQTGISASGDRIRREVAVKKCACEIKNPSGRCCLGEVLAAEKVAQQKFQKVVCKKVI